LVRDFFLAVLGAAGFLAGLEAAGFFLEREERRFGGAPDGDDADTDTASSSSGTTASSADRDMVWQG